MVSLVIVSHSEKLAHGVRELADQMVQGQVAIAAAGGIDDPENPIGTDPMKVLAAIEQVYSDDGVLVLMDLGSALMSAEMALEFMAPEQAQKVRLCAAPLVEGAVAAAVQAMTGGTLDAVIAEGESALLPKRAQLGIEEPEAAPPPVDVPSAADGPRELLRLTVPNKLGLHARPAAKLVNIAGRFDSPIEIRKGERIANGKSLNQVATLGARQGDELIITAGGPDAAAVLQAIRELAEDNFGDDDEEVIQPDAVRETGFAPDGLVQGLAASPGVAVGPAALYRPQIPEVETRKVENATGEWVRLLEALAAAEGELAELQRQTTQTAGAGEAAIFDAHTLILEDPDLHTKVQNKIETQQINAEAAWFEVIEETAQLYEQLDDAYLRARAQDVRDVGQRVVRHLLHIEPALPTFERPVILVADDLSPSDTAQLSVENVLGVLTARGGSTGHSAILARALGIPAVVGALNIVPQIEDGQKIALDGDSGQVWLAPDDDEVKALSERRQRWLDERQAAQAEAKAEAVTTDGTRIEVAANIGSPRDAELAREYGAEGVGLFRTEFLFMDRTDPPSEEEQLTAYRVAAEAMSDQPLIVRTLDVGGDKPISYLDFGVEDNPFLGWRAIRYCLDHPEILLPQLRAVLRAAADHPIKLMFPMISNIEELHRAKAVLGEARASLERENHPYGVDMEVGIMVEVPSAVLGADLFAREVDFFSIGTNDLTQYVMAADRGNANVSGLVNALQPAVVRAIARTAEAAQAAGIWVGMCGELAGNPLATPLLVGLGLTELSMNAPAIPAVKRTVRELRLDRAREIAQKVLTLGTAAEIESYLAAVAELG